MIAQITTITVTHPNGSTQTWKVRGTVSVRRIDYDPRAEQEPDQMMVTATGVIVDE